MNYIFIFLIFLLTGCASYNASSPIIEGNRQTQHKQNCYVVQEEDSIYSIAWAFDKNFADIAKTNNIPPPYKLKTGKCLFLNTPSITKTHKENIIIKQNKGSYKKQIATKEPIVEQAEQIISNSSVKSWFWPAKGKLVSKEYAGEIGKKGINIQNRVGTKVIASSGGRVVYCGKALKGYGNLIIIKHTKNFLTAYAFNKEIFVHEGQVVKAGQQIATMGTNPDGRPMLHFELRYDGKPVNPLKYLK